MKAGSEEALLLNDYTFSLRALGHKKTTLSLFHDFSPVVWQKTFKTISSVPTYRSQCTLPFQTELDLPLPILKVEQEVACRPQQILIPKPSSQYCQICKQKFEDYMKHTSHPLHTQKVKQLHNQLNFDSLKDILKKSNKKQKKVTLKDKQVEQIFYSPVRCSSKDENDDKFQQKFSIGSKKRIVINDSGDLQVLSLIGSTKVIQSQGELSSHKSIRRFSITRQQKI